MLFRAGNDRGAGEVTTPIKRIKRCHRTAQIGYDGIHRSLGQVRTQATAKIVQLSIN